MSDNCCRVINTLYAVLFPDGHENLDYTKPIDGIDENIRVERLVVIRRLVERASATCDFWAEVIEE
jgi:hypothetical protein